MAEGRAAQHERVAGRVGHPERQVGAPAGDQLVLERRRRPVDVLTGNFERLPVAWQRILSLAGAIGVRFELPVLATVAVMIIPEVLS